MVTPVSATDINGGTERASVNRGFIPEEGAVAVGPGFGPVTIQYRPFWRPVMAGTVVVLSLFALSWYLMLGCHVGIHGGGIALGWGAALWMWITACVAFFCGGMIASAISATRGPGWLKGPVIWGLSMPAALLLNTIAGQSGLWAPSLYMPRAGVLLLNNYGATANGGYATGTLVDIIPYGFFWAIFITMACALVFSIVGSMAGSACNKDDDRRTL